MAAEEEAAVACSSAMNFFADADCTNDNYFRISMYKPDDTSSMTYAPSFEKQESADWGGKYIKQLMQGTVGSA